MNGPDSVRVLVARAESDLRAVDLCMAGVPVPWDVVSFHAQQAGEKYLKALLAQRGIRPPRTHDLRRLLTLCGEHGTDLSELEADCKLLTAYAVDSRYGELRPDAEESEGRDAVAAAVRVCAAVRPLLDAWADT